jgi:hypothetical protein
MQQKRPRWHVYLTGGEYIGPAYTLKVAELALRKYQMRFNSGEPIGTIYEEAQEGVKTLFRTYYCPGYVDSIKARQKEKDDAPRTF